MLEYVDRRSLDLIRSRFPELPQNAYALLLIEAEGHIDHDEWSDRLAAARAMVDDSWFAVNSTERERFRKLRHSLPESVNATVLQRGFMKMGQMTSCRSRAIARCWRITGGGSIRNSRTDT